jgi:hypothetical protein
MDLSRITEQDTATLELLDPKEKTPLGVAFTLAGPEHAKRRALTLTYQRMMRKQFSRAGRAQLQDPTEDREQETDLLVTCTLGWTTFDLEGKPYAFSDANARALYENPKFAWLRRQVKAALEDFELFIASSPAA